MLPIQKVSLKPAHRRVGLAVALCVFGLLAHQTIEYAKANILTLTYTDALDLQAAVGQCIVGRLTTPQKSQIAETVVRPPAEALFVKVLPAALEGAATDDKRAALRALRDRETLRSKAVEQVNAHATSCGYWKAGSTEEGELRAVADISPFQFALKWLAYDPGYKKLVASVQRRPPDAAQAMYDSLVPPRP